MMHQRCAYTSAMSRTHWDGTRGLIMFESLDAWYGRCGYGIVVVPQRRFAGRCAGAPQLVGLNDEGSPHRT